MLKSISFNHLWTFEGVPPYPVQVRPPFFWPASLRRRSSSCGGLVVVKGWLIGSLGHDANSERSPGGCPATEVNPRQASQRISQATPAWCFLLLGWILSRPPLIARLFHHRSIHTPFFFCWMHSKWRDVRTDREDELTRTSDSLLTATFCMQ